MRSAASAGDAAAATTSARKRRFIVTSPPSVVKRPGCGGAASDFGKSVAEVVVARLAGRANEGGWLVRRGCNPDGGEPTSNRICFTKSSPSTRQNPCFWLVDNQRATDAATSSSQPTNQPASRGG